MSEGATGGSYILRDVGCNSEMGATEGSCIGKFHDNSTLIVCYFYDYSSTHFKGYNFITQLMLNWVEADQVRI